MQGLNSAPSVHPDTQVQTIGVVRRPSQRLNEQEAERAKAGNVFRGLKW